MRLASALISCVLCVTGTVGGAWLSRPASVDYGSLLSKASDIYAVTDERGDATRLYVVNNASNAAISRIPGAAAELPWKVNVTYSLDGPNVEASEISGASGLVGIYIDVKPQSSAANHTIPVVTFTVPTQVTGDISADNTASVATQGSDIVVAAAGNVSSGLKFSCYMDAKKFSMGAVTLAALPSSGEPSVGADPQAAGSATQSEADAADQTAADTDASQLIANSATLVGSLTDAGSGEHQQLIDQLDALRSNERALDKSVVAERKVTHKQAFDAYMAAYVGAYTDHLSGSIGDSSQLSALMGTAGELSKNTPLAQAVIDLADAVNNVSAAHQHTGAVEALDEVIRRIQQQGTTGLADDLNTEAAEEATKGSKQYAEGQSQLSAAMIPYSMKYTDVYTANLSALTGGTSSGAGIHEQQAIAETNSSDDLTEAQSKVDAAMSTLATASEHTGKAAALRQIVLRFSDQFASSGNVQNASSGSGSVDQAHALAGLADAQSQSFYGKTRAAEAKRKASAARKQAKAAQQQQSQHADASLVDDTMSLSSADVMHYANGVNSSIGSSQTADTFAGGKLNSADGSTEQSSGKSKNAASQAGDSMDVAPTLFGFGSGGTLLKHDMSTLVNETVEISDAGELLNQAVAQINTSAVQQKTAGTRYLIVVPTV